VHCLNGRTVRARRQSLYLFLARSLSVAFEGEKAYGIPGLRTYLQDESQIPRSKVDIGDSRKLPPITRIWKLVLYGIVGIVVEATLAVDVL
jgi:hypothetical protein